MEDSASQHGLGWEKISVTSKNKIFELAGNLNIAKTDKDVSKIIYEANIPNLKVSVGTRNGYAFATRHSLVGKHSFR